MFKNSLIKFVYNLYPFRKGRRFLKPLYKYISGYEIIIDRNNNRMLLNLDNYIDSRIYLEGSYEKKHINLLVEKYLQYKCRYFIDIGANIGVYSIQFLKLKEVEKCFLFEPEPKNFAQLNANVFLNKVSRKAKLFNCALSNISGKMNFYIENLKKDIDLGKINTGTHSLENNLEREFQDSIEIDVFIGDFLVDIKDEIVCLKIDVEGHELSVIKGFEQLFTNNKCLIMIEIFPDRFNDNNKYLKDIGFSILDIEFDIGDNYFYKNF